jgi:hypothetical protein
MIQHRTRRSIETGAVVVVALAACAVGIANDFTQDDVALIRESSLLRDLSNWPRILSSPYWPPPYAADQYRPVTSLLLALQNAIGSGAPMVFRLVSGVLYAVASALLFRFASLLVPRGVALCVALLFAAHPVHVEPVALAVGQGEILVAIMGLVMLLRYVEQRRTGEGMLRARDWLLIAAMYATAAFSKEQGFLLPAVLLLAEIFLIHRDTLASRLRLVRAGYIALGLVGAALLFIRTAVLGAQTMQPNVAEALVTKTLAGRAVTMLQIVPEWLRLLAWPAHLRADYSPQEFVGSSSFGAKETLGLLLLLALIALAWRARHRAPAITFGLSWCALALFPVSNVFIPTGILIAERTLFLPSIGFLIAIGGCVAYGLERFSARALRPVLAVACGALVIAGVIRSALRYPVWRDNNALSLASVRDSPRSWRVRQSYAEAMFRLGRPREGVNAYQSAIELAPSPWWVRNSLARHLRRMGDDAGAVEQLQLSLAAFPAQFDVYPELTAALLGVGSYEQARAIANQVIASAGAPPVMVWLRHVADSAIATKAAPGSIKVGISGRDGRIPADF